MVVDPRDDEHRADGDEGEEPLPHDGVLEAGGGAVVGAEAAAVDEHEPVADEGKRGQREDRIESIPGSKGALDSKPTHGATFSMKKPMMSAAMGAALVPPTPRS